MKPTESETLPESSPEDFKADIQKLVDELSGLFGPGACRWYYEEPSETLYIELEQLHGLSQDDIEQKAGPWLDACDLDFEEIVLLPYRRPNL